jgi:predicted enzyme related to lactoylglutathione lyase
VLGRLHEVVIDCHDPESLARFWQAVLGGAVRHNDEWVEVHPPGGHIVGFQKVPEPKTGKNRVHLDVEVDDIEAAVRAAVELGATKVGDVVTDPISSFQVMLDPEGNEFCFVT